jgi:cytochrome c55X
MDRRLGLLAACAALALPPSLPSARAADAPAEPRRAEIVHLVRQDCGSCHGLTLKGGLGPPLLPAALRDKDPEQLRFVVLHGRRGTAMPPWSRFLSDAEAAWVIELLKKGLPGE